MIKFIAIIVTTVIGIIGLVSKPSFKLKLALGLLLLSGGVLAAYLTYNDDVAAKEREKRLQNIVLSSTPSVDQINRFNEILSDFSTKLGYRRFQFSNTPSRTSFDFSNAHGERTGYFVLSDAEVMTILSSTKREDHFRLIFEAPAVHAPISEKWNELVSELTSLVTEQTTEVGGIGASFDLDADRYEMSFQVIAADSAVLPLPTINFSRNELEHLLEKSRIERGAYVVTKCEKLFSKAQ